MNQELSPEQTDYIRRLARRYVQFRKSGSIDVDDLISVASVRWWQFCVRHPELSDERVIQVCFYQQVKGAMRDILRDSSPVKVTRTMQARMQAYQRPYTVELDSLIDIQAGEEHRDLDQWMDIVASLKKLPEREQIVLSLYFERDLNFSEIAKVLDLSVSTITRIYRRALDTVREDIAGHNYGEKKRSI
ncbi:sigma-70 family RNA polymerase sigma factor [Alicyclobacillus fastidiosus]|uniref:Sigma-70 family RNA polymerase sigma factor n=1 Tax=Alicyclobacillus fastidiosus TaxID=392011 RepID=A0ABY6ZIF8_9BACL|nr:sigma-70 family RNA polymerase sigma factor [Alicyclobacillus fastidiosus]WAH42642.1 sigma-70 family RNA polymerase sigma factor [Alicyclobacillus fastidiosus]GMA64516.1 hypothetical protein GCM10025859_49560 [Alicyclobacillus fastidiosus]